MAKDASFDVVSEFNLQELVNAVDQTMREISGRFDLKNTNSKVDLEADKKITISTSDETKLFNIVDILQSKMTKRGLSIKILDGQKIESALGGSVRQILILRKGLSTELAKKIVADIKEAKLKVQASIQADQVRVVGKNRDDLQEVIQALKQKEENYDAPLQFTNYR
ncbi:MAG: YajQ family cyclic di-GMP-binding protein [bacterium]